MSLSVIILTPGSFPTLTNVMSSVESTVIHTAPYLAKKNEITIIGKKFPDCPDEFFKDGVKYVNLSPSKGRRYLDQAVQYMRQQNPDIVQVENRAHYVKTVKENIPQAQVWLVLYSNTFLQQKYIKSNELKRSFEMADRIIVISEFLKEHIKDLHPGIEDKLYVYYLGVDANQFKSRFEPDVAAWKEKQRMQMGLSDEKVILFVGRLRRKKGVHRLIKSLAYLTPSDKNFVLYIVGGYRYGKNKKTRYVKRLYRLAKQSTNQVRFVPFQPMDTIHDYYLLADVVVVPSIYEEAFGLVNLEALSTGVPVVASKVGGIPEVIQDHKTGLLVPLKNHTQGIASALNKIFDNDDFARQLGLEGRKQVEKYWTWEHAAKRLLSYYQEVKRGDTSWFSIKESL